jgi:hypothetical protein
LSQENTPREVGATHIGVPQIGTDQISSRQISRTQIRRDQVSTAQVRATQIGTTQLRTHEIRTAAVHRCVRDAGTDQLTGPQQQIIDPRAMSRHIEVRQRRRTTETQTFGIDKSAPELALEGRCQLQRLGQVPQQLMQQSHHREHLEHLGARVRRLPPITPTERHLRDLLPGTEAVIHRATGKTTIPQPRMNAATEVVLQVRARLTGRLVDGEVGRRGQRQRHTAQPGALRTISAQVRTSYRLVGRGHSSPCESVQ